MSMMRVETENEMVQIVRSYRHQGDVPPQCAEIVNLHKEISRYDTLDEKAPVEKCPTCGGDVVCIYTQSLAEFQSGKNNGR